MKIRLLLCAAILLSLTTVYGQGVPPVDPTKSWRVLETKHYEIIYDVNEKKLAETFAAEAERAIGLLEPVLKTLPKKRIPLVIADITDSSNGAATALPYSQIEIYPVLPSVNDPTSEYYSWIREVVTHESTHIINFEPTSGLMSVLRFIFGSIIRPGGFLPRWYTEGLAVEMESRLTPVGRGRSNYYSAFVRSQVEDQLWGTETIDRIGPTSIPTWPRGSRPYTYGYFLMHQLGELPRSIAPEDNIYHLLDEDYGGRIPWLINGPVKNYFSLGYPDLLQLMYDNLRKKADAQLATLKARGAKNGEPLFQSGYFNIGAQISPDHLKMAAIVSDFDESMSIRVWTRSSPSEPFALQKEMPQPLIFGKDIHQLNWRADSQHLVYDRSDLWRHYSIFNDLYDIDIASKKETRLTEGLRAREATVLADESMAFVVATSTRTQLMHADKDGKNAVALYIPPAGDRLSSPRAFGDGVIYSHRDSRGHEWIESYSLKTKQISLRTRTRNVGEVHIMPIADTSSTNGGFYYAASYTGVMNIYYSDRNHTEAVTNVTTYAMSPTIDEANHQIIFSRLTSHGFELESAPIQHQSLPPTLSAMQIYPKAEEALPPPALIEDSHRYHGLSYLWPQYILPFIYFVPGGVLVDLTTSGADPLEHHQYTLDVGYDSRSNQPTEQFTYTNNSLPFTIDADFANLYSYIVGAGLVEQVTFGYLDSRHYLLPNSNKWIFGPELTYNMTYYPSPTGSYLFTQAGPGAYLSYVSIPAAKDYQISPESGGQVSVGYDYFLSQLGNTSYPNVHGTASLYLSGSLMPKHHVISLKGAAWVAPNQPTILTGLQQAGGEYFGSLLPSTFLVRGYPVGEFLGYTMYTGNFEYRFPLGHPYEGWGTFPLFFNNWHAALLADAITLEGAYYDTTLANQPNSSGRYATHIGTFYMGTGAEVRSDIQVFYGIPFTLRMGGYYGLTQSAYGGFTYFVGFGSVQ